MLWFFNWYDKKEKNTKPVQHGSDNRQRKIVTKSAICFVCHTAVTNCG